MYKGKRNQDFKYIIKDFVFDKCPKSETDFTMLKNAVEGYEILDSGVLPEVGGFLDQTQFFTKSSVTVRRFLKQMEADSYKKEN